MATIIDAPADTEAHGREQINHRQIVIVGIHLDARYPFHLAETVHLINKYARKTFSLIFPECSKAMDYVIVARGHPFPVDEVVLRFTIENDCPIDSHFAVYSEYKGITIVDIIMDALLRRVIFCPLVPA